MRAGARSCAATAVLLLATAGSEPALADGTVFAGSHRSPSGGALGGVALGVSLPVGGIEFEYAEARTVDGPLRSGMVNLLLRTPREAARLQLYASVGGGVYQESGAAFGGPGLAGSVGGGILVPLPGPFRVRIDYRVFGLRRSGRADRPQRIYAGVNLAF